MVTFIKLSILIIVINVVLGIQRCSDESEVIVGVQQSRVQIGCDVGSEFSRCSLVKMDSPNAICSNEDCDIERVIYIGGGHICQFELYRLDITGNFLFYF